MLMCPDEPASSVRLTFAANLQIQLLLYAVGIISVITAILLMVCFPFSNLGHAFEGATLSVQCVHAKQIHTLICRSYNVDCLLFCPEARCVDVHNASMQ